MKKNRLNFIFVVVLVVISLSQVVNAEFVKDDNNVTVLSQDLILTEDITIDGDFKLTGGTLDLAGRTMIINGEFLHEGGTLRVFSGTLIVNGDYRVQSQRQETDGSVQYSNSNGFINMESEEGRIVVSKDFIFEGGYHGTVSSRRPTAGILEVKGNFTVENDWFNPTGTHKVLLSGTEEQVVKFARTSSYFNELEISNPGENNIIFKTGVRGWTLHNDTVINGDFKLVDGTLDLAGKTMTINGDFTHEGGTLRVFSGTLIVNGDYRVQRERQETDGSLQYMGSNGFINMESEEGRIVVNEDFIFEGGYHGTVSSRRPTAGILEVKGHFTVENGWFNPIRTHKVLLSGTEKQVVKFASTSSYFNILEKAIPENRIIFETEYRANEERVVDRSNVTDIDEYLKKLGLHKMVYLESTNVDLDYEIMREASTVVEFEEVVTNQVEKIEAEKRVIPSVAEDVARYLEYGIQKVATKNVTTDDGKISIEMESVREISTIANEARESLVNIAREKDVALNRRINTAVEINVEDANLNQNPVNLEIKKDILDTPIDELVINLGNATLTFPLNRLQNELEDKDSLEINISSTNSSAKNPILLASASNVMIREYIASFTISNEINLSGLKGSNAKLGLELSSDNPDENTIMKDGINIGGIYNKGTEMLETVINGSGNYKTVVNKVDFVDIESKDQIVQRAIRVMATKGIINGMGDGVFMPDGEISRAQFATMITKVLSMWDDDIEIKFTDTQRTAWYYPFVARARKYGLVNGYPDNTFRPNRTINKNELLTVCANALMNRAGYYMPDNNERYLNYADKDNIPQWARNTIALAQREGLVVRRADGKLIGEEAYTRATVAVILHRLYERM